MMTTKTDEFADLPQALRTDIARIINRYPDTAPAFTQLYNHFTTAPAGEPFAKKRKLDTANGAGTRMSGDLGDLLYTVQDISIQSPARKKLDLNIHTSGISLTGKGGSTEFTVPKSALKHFLCVPTPNKAKPHYTICLLSDFGDHVIFGFDDRGSGLRLLDQSDESSVVLDKDNSAKEKITAAVGMLLKRGTTWGVPDARLYAKCAKRYPFVNCYVGAKEGHLYFLTTGLFFGFKKPIIHIPYEDLSQLNLANATGRTFSFVLETNKGGSHEFAMIEAADQNIVSAFMGHCHELARKRVQEEGGDVEGEGPESEEEDDDDFKIDEDEDDVAEEYNSDHETDSQPSEDGEGEEEDEGEGEQDEEDESGGDELMTVEYDEPTPVKLKQGRVTSKAMDAAFEAVAGPLGVEEMVQEEEQKPEPKLTGMAALAAQIEKERKARQQGSQ